MLLKEKQQDFSTSKVSFSRCVEICDAIELGTISGKMAKTVFEQSFESDKPLDALIQESGGAQISDNSELQEIVLTILKQNQDVVEKIKAGKTNSANLMGQVMKETKGRAKPDTVRQLILDTVSSL